MRRSNKRRGSEFEVELCHIVMNNNYRVIRVAGSGTLNNADCDIIVADKRKTYCIEAKSTKKGGIYIPKYKITVSKELGLKDERDL